ncbi:hypothetical protein [Nocardia otitidiscaviarum]|uniref:hypothetical protein n=1 Tax=Nocardia otitidiscaviarum TaxID=1823 RepID=UPI0024589381|nr:hypothetical protein [Nocardia otitidiscaviarum]
MESLSAEVRAVSDRLSVCLGMPSFADAIDTVLWPVYEDAAAALFFVMHPEMLNK